MVTEVAELGDRAGDVLALADEVATVDGVEALSEQFLLDVRRPLRPVRHLLAVDDDGVLVGYAQVQPGDDEGHGPSAELAVLPTYRRRGIGRALLDAVLTEPGVAVWAHGDLPAARALATSTGLTRVRELLQMGRPLGDRSPAVVAPETPTDVVVTEFRPGHDENAWVRLNARAFANHPEQGRMTVDDLLARQAEAWFDPSLLWLVRGAGEAGAAADERTGAHDLLASMWVKPEPDENSAEIYALAVDPSAQGRGLGRMLTRMALAEMVRRGVGTATLYVEGDNTAARRTYEREGFTCVATDVQYS